MKKLLIVDDNEQNLYLLQVLLTANGFQTEQATNGAEALEKARRAPPDMIVSDILMPVMDGYALCRSWKEDKDLKNIPFVFYTATYTESKDEEFALSLGADRFIVKPSSPDKFLALLLETEKDYEAGKPVSAFQLVQDAEYYKEYNAAIIRKLEDKMLQLEEANRILEHDIAKRKEAEEKQKNLEEQLRQSQKLEAIGQLSSGVAHDFNNLLGGILGNAELLKMHLNPGSPLLRQSEIIISLCQKASNLTRQLLSFARKAPVELTNIDLNLFIREVADLLDRTIDHCIEISIDTLEQPAFISGDRNLLENAILNIAINARDAMPDGGRLHITLEIPSLNRAALPEEPLEIKWGSFVKISIADTGIGMDKKTKDRIFEPFFTTKEIGKGTGLGLASVYGCVKQHNGYIAVESQEGKGTKFDLYFPIVSSDDPVASPKAEMLLRGNGTLLVIDDEPVFHEILTNIFTSLGYTVHCCANGADALEYYHEHSSAIKVVILDMNMPKMNGLHCFRNLKKINPDVQVIVTSGYGDNSDHESLRKEGVSTFVQKPYKATELSVKIAELIK